MSAPIRKCGRLIGNGYSDVFDALLYNGKIKMSILHDAKSIAEKMKGYNTTDELFDNILENWFIEDLIQPPAYEDIGDKNIFDIFLEMRSHMPETTWNELFNGLLITLWEFCGILFDNSDVYINKAVAVILTEIYNNCTVGKKNAADLGDRERKLKENYEILLRRRYGEE